MTCVKQSYISWLILLTFGCSPPAYEASTAINNSAASKSFDHDFGVVNRGDMIEHTFVVVNDSSVPWTVQKTFVTCSCTGVLLSVGDRISAGDSKEVSLVFDAGDQLGKRAEVATIYFDAKLAPVLSFRVTADVRTTSD